MNNRRNILTRSVTSLGIEQGKVPPQCPDMETAVLGSMIIDRSCIDDILSILKPESFYKDNHQKIYAAISDMRKENKVIDILTVTHELRQRKELEEIGGPVYITSLTSNIASTRHAEEHAYIIQDAYMKRELIRISSEVSHLSFDESEDTEEIISYFNIEVNKINSEGSTQTDPLNILIKERVREIEEIARNGSKLVGVPSGLNIDKLTGGWQSTDLIILAARPSMGKTSLALNLALRACEYKYPTAFFSLEMSKNQITDRTLSAYTSMTPIQIRTGNVNWSEVEQGISVLEKLKMFVDDTAALSIVQLKSKISKLLRYGLKLVVVDYLQLMNGKISGGNREQEISELSRGVKAICKDTGLPIILLSQLNRSVELRANKRPQLSDLRESGAIEQDADLVMFLRRPEYYGMELTEDGKQTKGLVEIFLEKHRNGPIGMVECYTNECLTKFYNDDPYQPVNIDRYEKPDF